MFTIDMLFHLGKSLYLKLFVILLFLTIIKWWWSARFNDHYKRTTAFDNFSPKFNLSNRRSFENVLNCRKTRVEKICHQKFGKNHLKLNGAFLRKSALPLLFINDFNRIIFCGVPKAASSSWRRFFIEASGGSVTNSTDLHAPNEHLRPFYTYSDEELDKRLDEYTKIAIVRHPFHRILSGKFW